nr:division/cell wall cluster transcriptional repressor MraZ [Cellulomonas timonensis]
MSIESTFSGFGSSAPFLGTYTPRLDDKGRLILPAKFRAQLAPGLVMTRGQERCLFLLPMDEFRRMHDQIRQAPVTSKQARDYLRVFLSGASDELPDKQGRISIPPMLRTYAGLDREVAVIGAGSRVEVWDLEAWETYLAEQEAGYAETAEEVFPNGPF